MMKDQDVIEFHDYKQSVLLKMLRIYQETYNDCDGDRLVVEGHGVQIKKTDLDQFISDNDYNLSVPVVAFFLNYIIRYSEITKKIPPYFVILTTEDYNPSFGNVILYNNELIKQISLAKFKYDGNKQNAPIVILMKCKTKWNMIILELQPWIIDFKCDKHTKYPEIEQFASQFIQDTFGIQIKNFNDFMLDHEQPGDSGDLIVYGTYKIFILNLDLMSDTILTKQDVTTAKRKLIWLALSHMRERSKADDEAELVRRVIAKQREEMLKQMQEEEERRKEAKNRLNDKKQQVYGFLNQEEVKKVEIVPETPEQILLKRQLAQFNATRPRNKVESFLTRLKVKEEFQPIPEAPVYVPPLKDPRAKVKNFVYEVQMPKGKPEVKQLITPASYCVAELFNSEIQESPQPSFQRVFDYEILEKSQQQNYKSGKPIGQGYFSEIGSRLFDNRDYTVGQVWGGIKKEKHPTQKPRIVTQSIEQLEEELFRNV